MIDLRRKPDGAPRIERGRHYWVDEDNQPIPDRILEPCVVLHREGVNFAIEYSEIPRLRELLDECERTLI